MAGHPAGIQELPGAGGVGDGKSTCGDRSVRSEVFCVQVKEKDTQEEGCRFSQSNFLGTTGFAHASNCPMNSP